MQRFSFEEPPAVSSPFGIVAVVVTLCALLLLVAASTVPDIEFVKAHPAAEGFAPDRLEKLDARIRAEHAYVKALLILRRGRLVHEKYYQGDTTETLFGVRSVTKTVTALLVGLALAGRTLPDLEGRIVDLVPGYAPADERFRGITLRHLLSMTSGLGWDEKRDQERIEDNGDAVALAYGLPVAAAPGSVYNYNSCNSHLLSAALARAAGTNEAAWAARVLFAPLGIARWEWPADGRGVTWGGGNLALRARDMARLGQLLLDRGRWQGRQVVPAAWIRAMTTPRTAGGWPFNESYGYHCWIGNGAGHRYVFAGGWGGQYILVLPDSAIVAVIASAGDEERDFHRELVEKEILPILERRPAAAP